MGAIYVFADRLSAQTMETAQHTSLSFITCMNPAILTDQFNLVIMASINDYLFLGFQSVRETKDIILFLHILSILD